MSVVYAVQNQQKRDRISKRLVDKFDLSSAQQFGEVKFLLSPTAAPFHPESVIRDIRDGLAYLNQDDYLLLIGNPCLIGFTVSIAASLAERGRLKLLQWSGKDQSYILVEATVFPLVAG